MMPKTKPFLERDFELARQHLRVLRGERVLDHGCVEEDAALGDHEVPTLCVEEVRDTWARTWSHDDVSGLYERLCVERSAILDSMAVIPKVAPGPLPKSRIIELAKLITPIRDRLRRWTYIHRSFTSLCSVFAYVHGRAPTAEALLFDPKCEPLSSYNKLRSRLLRQRAVSKERRAAYDAKPDRRAARKAWLVEKRKDPAYLARENARRRERYAQQRELLRSLKEEA